MIFWKVKVVAVLGGRVRNRGSFGIITCVWIVFGYLTDFVRFFLKKWLILSVYFYYRNFKAYISYNRKYRLKMNVLFVQIRTGINETQVQ